jgi:hypothetical protein
MVARAAGGVMQMHNAIVGDSAARSARDRIVIGLILACTAVALSLELYWLIFNDVMESRTDVVARILSIYWPADYSWRVSGHPPQKAVSLYFETINVFVTPLLSFGLIWAIVRRRPYRFPLQLVIGTYTVYGTLAYYGIAHFSDYAQFDDKGVYQFALFHFVNMPWLVGYGWLAWDAFREIVRKC